MLSLDELDKQTKERLDQQIKTKRLEKKGRRARQLRCFWTWPWGHIWKAGETSYDRICAICGKKSCPALNPVQF